MNENWDDAKLVEAYEKGVLEAKNSRFKVGETVAVIFYEDNLQYDAVVEYANSRFVGVRFDENGKYQHTKIKDVTKIPDTYNYTNYESGEIISENESCSHKNPNIDLWRKPHQTNPQLENLHS
ncbi:hypothetical protein MXB_4745, partial [Myxobolus squamalis]